MNRWRSSFKLKDLLTDETDGPAIRRIAVEIVRRIRLYHPDAPHSRFTDAIQQANEGDPETALLVFNDAMGRLYDWADNERVWVS